MIGGLGTSFTTIAAVFFGVLGLTILLIGVASWLLSTDDRSEPNREDEKNPDEESEDVPPLANPDGK